MEMTMNKRQLMLRFLDGSETPDYVPAAFFLHFDPAYHRGQAAVNKHLEFFRETGMDFVKIQYEQPIDPRPVVQQPEDWQALPRYDEDFFAEPLQVVEGVVTAAREEALVVVTLYSPFMWASQIAGAGTLMQHAQDNPALVQQGMESITESVRTFARACIRLGVDGFYASTQGGESTRFADGRLFETFVKPYDLAIMNQLDQACIFNILHICDYHAGYDDLTRFLDYPGQVVSAPSFVGGQPVSPQEMARRFNRPYMGGLERTGVIATGTPEEVRAAAAAVLEEAPSRFILAADCTVPADTPWINLRTAVDTAHRHGRK
jgi:uroporphyrinogen decarboxylase